MKGALVFSLSLSLCIGGTAMYLAWQHNPQCAIHCEGAIRWRYWLLLGASWAVPVFMVLVGLAIFGAKIFPQDN